jgi:hypothetical protein
MVARNAESKLAFGRWPSFMGSSSTNFDPHQRGTDSDVNRGSSIN